MHQKINQIYVFAKPGAGKDTQIDKYIERYPENAGKVYPGGLLRNALNNPADQFHELVKPYREYIQTGRYIPGEIALPIIRFATQQLINEGKRTIFYSGYPYTLDLLENTADIIQQELTQNGYEVQPLYVFIGIANQEAKNHLLYRGKKEGMGRVDDTPVIINERIARFVRETKEVKKVIMNRNDIEYRIIRGNGSENEVAAAFESTIENFIFL